MADLMAARRVAWTIAALAAGCAFDTGGVGTGPGSASLGSTGDETSVAEVSSDDGGTTEQTTSGVTSMMPDDSGTTTTAGGATDPGSTTDDSSTTDDPSTTDGGQLPPPPYSACDLRDAMQCWPGQICVDAIDGYTLCSQTGCNSSADCPAPPSGNAAPHCTQEHNCVLDCGTLDSMCPTGMDCVYLWEFVLWRCAWPNP